MPEFYPRNIAVALLAVALGYETGTLLVGLFIAFLLTHEWFFFGAEVAVVRLFIEEPPEEFEDKEAVRDWFRERGYIITHECPIHVVGERTTRVPFFGIRWEVSFWRWIDGEDLEFENFRDLTDEAEEWEGYR